MTNKELFIKVVERARKEAIALNKLEHALGNIVIENDLEACFSFCDEICGFLLFGKDILDCFYDDFWDFINNGATKYVVDGSYRLITTAEGVWDFWQGEEKDAV